FEGGEGRHLDARRAAIQHLRRHHANPHRCPMGSRRAASATRCSPRGQLGGRRMSYSRGPQLFDPGLLSSGGGGTFAAALTATAGGTRAAALPITAAVNRIAV